METRYQKYMELAIKEAKKTGNITHPNPRVGAVLVHNDKIISSGYHSCYGLCHAETACLKNAVVPDNSELYVTMEPCNHEGKTPPCTGLIIKSGVKKVIIAAKDNNPGVAGGGAELLQKNGIPVIEGVLEKEALELNKEYFFANKNKRPYVNLKYAMTLDGKIADNKGDSHWISGRNARAITHALRANIDAILVGSNTVIRDDPELTVRDTTSINFSYRQPTRVILDRKLSLPLHLNVFQSCATTPTIIVTSCDDKTKKRLFTEKGVEIITVNETDDNKLNISPMLKKLCDNGIMSLLVEGGSQVNASFLNRKYVEEVHIFAAPRILGGENIYPPFSGIPTRTIKTAVTFRDITWKIIGEDIYFNASPVWG